MNFNIDGNPISINYTYDSLFNNLSLTYGGDVNNINIPSSHWLYIKNNFNDPNLTIHPAVPAGIVAFFVAKAVKDLIDYYCEEKIRNQSNALIIAGCKAVLTHRCSASCHSWK